MTISRSSMPQQIAKGAKKKKKKKKVKSNAKRRLLS